MKSNAIIRIVLLSITILVLSSLLIGGILLKNLSFQVFNGELQVSDLEDGTVSSSGFVNASEIRNIEIDWAAGTITLIPGNTDSIQFSETGARDESDVMVWVQDGDTLKIQYSEGEVHFNGISFGITANISKNLTITVPENWMCNELDIESGATDLEVQDLNIRNVEINNASGNNSFSDCVITDLVMETASGDISFTGSLQTLECEAVSADCVFHLTNVPQRLEMETVSGDLTLYLPQDAGFTATLDTVSGSFDSDFTTTSRNGSHIAGDGSCSINISGVSGDIEINQNK